MNSSQPDSRQVVATTSLPYIVPLDLMERVGGYVVTTGMAYLFLTSFVSHSAGWFERVSATALLAASLFRQFFSYRLAFDEAGIFFTNQFGRRKREVPWSTIKSVRTERGADQIEDLRLLIASLIGLGASGYLIVLDRSDGQPRVSIGLKSFPMEGLKIFVLFLLTKAQQAQFDEVTRKLAEGIAPATADRSGWFTGERSN